MFVFEAGSYVEETGHRLPIAGMIGVSHHARLSIDLSSSFLSWKISNTHKDKEPSAKTLRDPTTRLQQLLTMIILMNKKLEPPGSHMLKKSHRQQQKHTTAGYISWPQALWKASGWCEGGTTGNI